MSRQWFGALTAAPERSVAISGTPGLSIMPDSFTFSSGTAPTPSVYGTIYHEGLKVTDELGVYKIHFVFPESMDTSTPLSDEECRRLEAAETMLDVMTPIVRDLTTKCLETCRTSEWKNLNGETLFIARVVIASCEPHVQAMIHSIRKFNADHGIKG